MVSRRAPVLNYAAPVRLLLAHVQLEPSASSVDPLSSVDDALSPSVVPFTAATHLWASFGLRGPWNAKIVAKFCLFSLTVGFVCYY